MADLLLKTEHFEEMAVAVAGQRGNSHTCQNFSQTVVNTQAHFLECAGFFGFGEFLGEIRNHCACARGQEHRDVVGLEDLRALDDQRDVGVSLAHGALPKFRSGEEHWQRRSFCADISVGEKEEPRALAATQRGS